MRVLLLGSSGFLGRHLAAELRQRGDAVEGWSRSGNAVDTRRVDLLVRDSFARFTGPWDAAVLLAGHTVPGAGFDATQAAENVRIAENALEHLAQAVPGARVVVLSSAHVYARRARASDSGPFGSGDATAAAAASIPIDESHAIAPAGDYGRSKLKVENLAHERASELDVVIARSFNQIGPGQPRGLFVPDLLAAFARGTGPIRMNGSDGLRDFVDVRDGARAIADLVALRGARGETFNVCTGRAIRLSQVARGLAERLDVRREIVFEPGPLAELVGSPGKLARATGWKPQFTLDQTLDWIAEASRSR